MKKHTIQLGNVVRCKVTGFKGIAVSRLEYLNGCIQYGIKPPMDKKVGKMPDIEYVDSQQLEVVGTGLSVAAKDTGGPSTDAPKHEYRG
jgi:hypothetical protein